MVSQKNVLLIWACVLLSSCAKEGPAGPAGPAGQDGTASGNVHVESFTAPSAEWVQLPNGLAFTQQVPSLTQDVIDNDALLLYMKRNNTWYVLPHQVFGLQYSWSYQPGEVVVTVTGTQIPFDLTCKVVYVSDSE